MDYIYTTENTCARQIKLTIENDIVKNIEFLGGGCNGNLQALPRILEGWSADEIASKCSGITCGRRPTSCADQLVHAIREAQQAAIQNAQ